MQAIEIMVGETAFLMLSGATFMPKSKKQTKVAKGKTKSTPRTVDNPPKTSTQKFSGRTW